MTAHARLRTALSDWLASRELPADSGVSQRWVWVRVLGVPIGFPNFDARRTVLVTHDVHHLLTGYGTDWTGEGEISGFEIATGCKRYWAAWMFDLAGLLLGLAIAPRRTFRAFVRGRHCTNFYGEPQARLLDRTVAAARTELGLDRGIPPATARDAITFAAWAVVVIMLLGVFMTFLAVGVILVCEAAGFLNATLAAARLDQAGMPRR